MLQKDRQTWRMAADLQWAVKTRFSGRHICVRDGPTSLGRGQFVSVVLGLIFIFFALMFLISKFSKISIKVLDSEKIPFNVGGPLKLPLIDVYRQFQILHITVSMADTPNFSCLWLKVVSHRMGLCQELLGYFGLFLIRFCKEGKLSGKERRNAGQPGAGEGTQPTGCRRHSRGQGGVGALLLPSAPGSKGGAERLCQCSG